MPNPLTTRHQCVAYCRAPEHCDLLYVTATVGREAIRATLAPAVFVTRAEPAREAPPAEAHRQDVIVPGGAPAARPWLVWWRGDYRAALAEFRSWPARWPAEEDG